MVQRVTYKIGDEELILETGRLAKQANGAVYAQFGGSAVIATVCASGTAQEGLDYVPVTVDYNEKYYAAGYHEYDFTKVKGKPNVVVMAADIHTDVQTKADYDENGNFVSSPYHGEILPETAIIVNATQTDCIWGQSRKFPEKNNHMVKGTHTEQCFDVVTFLENGNIRMTRIGAGKDREVKYN